MKYYIDSKKENKTYYVKPDIVLKLQKKTKLRVQYFKLQDSYKLRNTVVTKLEKILQVTKYSKTKNFYKYSM